MPRPSRSSTTRKRIVQQSSDSSEEEESQPNNDITISSFQPLAHSSMAVLNITQIDTAANTETLVTNLVKFFLNYSSTKLPIKRADISKSVNITPKNFTQVLADAKLKLEIIYGLKVEELSTKSGKVYILYSNVKSNISPFLYNQEQQHEISFLFIILSLVFMKNGEIQENNLMQFLSHLNIHDHETHPQYGDVGKLIRETLPRQLYLCRTKLEIEGSNEVHFNLSWGHRANVEFDKKVILKSVAGLLQKSPATFVNQYNQAHGEEPVTATQAIAIEIDE